MTFINAGGDGSGPDWVAYVVIAVFVLSPVMLGLALRVWDRRTGAASAPRTDPKPRWRISHARFLLVISVAALLALGFWIARLDTAAALLGASCLGATMMRYGYHQRS